MNIDTMRAEFEAAMPRQHPRDRNMPDGSYNSPYLHIAWEVWQIARRTPTVTNASSTSPTAPCSAAAAAPGASKLPPLPEPLEIDWPELHSQALGCGVEDRGIRDRYEAAEYGWQDGVDKAAERVPEQIFDADQMREYAQLALAGQCGARQEPVTYENERAYNEACNLAKAIHAQHYREDSSYWRVLPDLRGVISQISNMTAGMTRIDHVYRLAAPVSAQQEPVARLHEEISDRPFTEGKPYFEITILDRKRCFDGMNLYAAPVSVPGAPKSDAKRMESDGAQQGDERAIFDVLYEMRLAPRHQLEEAAKRIATIAPVSAQGEQPAHETIVREGDSLVCTACGTTSGAQHEADCHPTCGHIGAECDFPHCKQGDERAAALEEAAKLAIKFTAVPRDVLGPATMHMKTLAAVGEKLAAAIRALPAAPAQKTVPHHFACEQKGFNPLCAGCAAELAAAPEQTPRGTPEQHAALQELVDIAQENDMGYGPPAQTQNGESKGKAASLSQGAGEDKAQRQIEWSHDLQSRLIEVGKDQEFDVRNIMAEAACLLAYITGRAVNQASAQPASGSDVGAGGQHG